ncbi:MAG: SPOR domain-containing protein [Gammaproteobacteria bacterium]|nr:SPOR domain-containing protein [Gammaproteobacteria bacterium]
MDNISFVQRILGAIILLSLAIIFVPMILEQENDINENIRGTNIPSMPDNVATVVFQLDNEGVFRSLKEQVKEGKPVSIREALENEHRVLPAQDNNAQKTNATEEATNKPRIQESTVVTEGAAMTWMVQLGSFSSEKNALELRDRLRKADYPAYLRERKNEAGKTIWQVRVGPELSAKKAVELKQRLESTTGLESLVVRHP